MFRFVHEDLEHVKQLCILLFAIKWIDTNKRDEVCRGMIGESFVFIRKVNDVMMELVTSNKEILDQLNKATEEVKDETNAAS